MAPNESTWVWMAGKVEGSKEGMKAIAVGQILSLLVTCTGLTSAVLARRGIDAPTAQSLFNYILLALVYGSLLIYRGKRIQISWYIYLLLAFLDVEGNYLAVKAYQYTSITSVMLLDCWTIPCVLLLTWLILKTRYAVPHFVGVAICVGGLVMVIFSDVHADDRTSGGSNVVLGDSLVICASMLYAISNVSEEFVVKKVDQVEFLAHLGMFGAVISACQLLVLEIDEVRSIQWSVSSIAPFLGFSLSIFAFSSLVPQLLRMNGSTMFNLSLLTSDMWAVAVRALGFHESVDSLYFVAFGLVVVGLVVYAVAGEPSPSPEGGSILSGERYKQVDQVDITADALVEGELACLPVDEEQQADGAAMGENAPLTSVAV